jgi:ubiquinone/menaquinone biosynthesis C-methylase UbiE
VHGARVSQRKHDFASGLAVRADGAMRPLDHRFKLLLFFLVALVALSLVNTGYSALNTISRLDAVEAERDQWQRPAEVLQALGIRPGDVVVDLGCGSGYFALKLSPPAGKNGRVLAEDIRRLPLVFLWFRAILKRERNITVVHGSATDPHLPRQGANEVLIANTYHELSDPQAILAHVRESLVSGGRLVVVDRTPNPADIGATSLGEHEVSAEQVESALRQAQFEISLRRNDFIEKDPDNESWWLMVARKP